MTGLPAYTAGMQRLILLLAVGCSTSDRDGSDSAPVATELPPTEHLSGELTWSLAFAEQADCEVTLAYDAVEDRSHPWLCSECDVMYQADIEVIEGDDTCLSQVEGLVHGEQAWLGRSEDRWFTSGILNHRLDVAADLTLTDEAVTISGGASPVADVAVTLSGELQRTYSHDDDMAGMTPPATYTCGWSKADPVAYEGPWDMEVGGQLADGWFEDQCGESVRLFDLLDDSYLIIDISAVYCEPCQRMASEHHEFTEAMLEAGIAAKVVTLLTINVSKQLETPEQIDLTDWAEQFELADPVLASRGWGYWSVGFNKHVDEGGDPAEFKGNGMPTWLAVAPDGEILQVSSGYGSWGQMEYVVKNHFELP
jgi:hypothetical protein